jgi:hypothetical protein
VKRGPASDAAGPHSDPRERCRREYRLKSQRKGRLYNDFRHIEWYDYRARSEKKGMRHILFNTWT